ncbi:MAG: hypothetical protein ACLP01_01995 [Solirubrobacteraceae bacterium]
MDLDLVTAVIPSVPEPAGSARAPHSTENDLQAITDLRDRGLFTEHEFAKAKRELLG